MPTACIGVVCYDTIEEAVAGSAPGDIVSLNAGIHHAAVVVDHDVNFVRDNDDDVIIRDGLDGEPIFRVTNGAAVTIWNIALAAKPT